ncbi:MAG: cupin domain-containing protein [Candidatus Aminicenantes bacterium]|nr:cupin domain-containing protein [Candidatus Aminicenantes bacterium]
MNEIMKVKEIVSYQNQAIVSKTLIEKETGTVTIFAFDQDQALSEHTAPFDALVEVIDGQAEIRIDGIPHQLNEGDMMVMPAHQSHALKALMPFKMLLTMIRSENKKR